MAGSGKPIELRALDPLTPHRYKRDEQPKRVGFWYIGVGTATILGSLMSFGFQHYTGTTFSAWQIMFLVIGCMTMLVGSSVLLFLPDNPMTARRLTHAERVLAVERLRENQTGVENKHFKPYQVLACLSDPQTWLLSIITIAASIPNGAVGSFQSILIKGFGFTNYQTTLLQIPGGVIAVTSVLLATWSAAKFNARAANIILWSAMGGILGGSLLAFLPEDNRAGKMAGNYLTHVVGSFLPCAYSFAAANTGGHTKKVTMNAVLLMSFCLGEFPIRSRRGGFRFTDNRWNNRKHPRPADVPRQRQAAVRAGESDNRRGRQRGDPDDRCAAAVLPVAEQDARPSEPGAHAGCRICGPDGPREQGVPVQVLNVGRCWIELRRFLESC